MKSRSAFRNLSEYLLVRSLFFLLRILPDASSLALARTGTSILRRVTPRLSQVALRNLSLTMPHLSSDEKSRILDGVFRSIARLLWVTAKTACTTRDIYQKYMDIENLDVVTNALKAGRGVLFATGHLGAWELSALGFGALVQPMDVIARPLDNAPLDDWITKVRTASGNRILSKKGTLREVLRALAENRAVGFLVDHNVISSDLCFVRFLGVETAASTVFAKIAHRSGAAVIPGFALWDAERKRFVLRFYERITITGDAVVDTQSIHALLEVVVRDQPDQWLWIHRRFKTRPPGEPNLYSNLGDGMHDGNERIS